jgi:peroxiredoxin Q/BCP
VWTAVQAGSVELVLGPGDVVEDWELPDQAGTPRRLSDLLADGPLVLFFYPAAMTYGCTRETCHFRDATGELQAVGAHAVGISADPVDKQKAFADKHQLRFPLLSDPDRRVAAMFGVTSGFKLGPVKRATFVIDQERRILASFHHELRFASHADEAIMVLREKSGFGQAGH